MKRINTSSDHVSRDRRFVTTPSPCSGRAKLENKLVLLFGCYWNVLFCCIYSLGFVALIHDDSIDLQRSKESVEIAIEVVIENLKSQCNNPVSMDVISVALETDIQKKLEGYKGSFNMQNSDLH